MKPPSFTYHRPETRDEVDNLLARLGDEAKILAGGQSLIPILNFRLSAPEHLIDINHLSDEPTVPEMSDGVLSFGPLVRQSAAERSELVTRHIPLLREALSFVAHPAIRSRGTIVGSIAHADPAAELPAVLVLLSGEVCARCARGRRWISAQEFFLGPLDNALADDEWVEEVRVPVQAEGSGSAFEEFTRRSGDFALCGVGALAEASGGSSASVRLTYLGMGGAPQCISLDDLSVEDAGSLEQAVRGRAVDLDAYEDVHASPRYRKWLAAQLGTRAARRAIEATTT